MTGIVSIASSILTPVVSTPSAQGLALSRCLSGSSQGKTPPAGTADGEDRRLVQGCIERDPAALRELLSRYHPQLPRFLGPAARIAGRHLVVRPDDRHGAFKAFAGAPQP